MASKKNIHYPLLPLSVLYGAGVYFRNKLFDFNLLKSERFPLPVICVGNITVGGTGKTPHIEYLIRLLQGQYRVAVLSRGYKRQSKGFQLAGNDSTALQLGDEPYQIHTKFPSITVAVDSDRRHGITQLLKCEKRPDVILLDDAYQHRYVKAGLNILLTDCNRMIYDDALLPAGRLRESMQGVRRADLIITTKCPSSLSDDEQQTIKKRLSSDKRQELFFSGLSYAPLRKVFGEEEAQLNHSAEILLVSGIARPELFQKYIGEHYTLKESMLYPDHHDFNKKDIQQIEFKFSQISNKDKAVIVTEKDAVRLKNNPYLNEIIKEHLYFLPLEVVILHSQTKRFNQIILDYVAENQRNS